MKKTIYDKAIYFMILLYYVSIYVADTMPGGQYLTLIPVAALFALGIIKRRGVIRITAFGYFVYTIAFLAFCALSRLWAQNPQLAVTKINSIFFGLVAMLAISICLTGEDAQETLLSVIMYGGYLVVLYAIVFYGWSGILNRLSTNERLTEQGLNANILGMCIAYAMVINFYYIIYDRIKLRDVMMLPAIVVLAASGSRKSILIVILGALGIAIFKNLNNKNALKSLVRVTGAVIIVAAALAVLSRLSIFSQVNGRFANFISLLQGNETRSTSDAWIRMAYIKLGMDLFKQHPLLGIGIANANIYTQMYYNHNHYLHNNFVEMLACGGLVGFTLYYSIYIYLLSVFIRLRKYRDRIYDITFILMIIFLVMSYGIVTYYNKDSYFLLLLFFLESRELRAKARAIVSPTQAEAEPAEN